MRTKVVYIISDIQKSLAFEWIAQYIDRQRFDLTFILLGKPNSAIAKELKKLNVHVKEFPLGRKSVRLVTFFKICKSLLRTKPDVIHTHLFQANIFGLTAGWMLRVPKRITTRHHAIVHHTEFPQGLKWDKIINWLATDIIAISKNTENILVELDGVNPRKVHHIPHGFDLSYFQQSDDSHLLQFINRWGIKGKHPVVGIISRYLELKGIQYVIPAFRKLLERFPFAHLILANTVGQYKPHVQELLKSLPVSSYTEIEFESDLATLYRVFDVYVHTPIDAQSEAFGQTYVEALASGVPSVFSLSGIAPEFIIHEQNALVVPFKNSEAIYDSIIRIITLDQLRETLVRNGKLSASLFSITNMINSLSALYEE